MAAGKVALPAGDTGPAHKLAKILNGAIQNLEPCFSAGSQKMTLRTAQLEGLRELFGKGIFDLERALDHNDNFQLGATRPFATPPEQLHTRDASQTKAAHSRARGKEIDSERYSGRARQGGGVRRRTCSLKTCRIRAGLLNHMKYVALLVAATVLLPSVEASPSTMRLMEHLHGSRGGIPSDDLYGEREGRRGPGF